MTPRSDNARGALLMAVAMAGFSCNDALMKGVLTALSLPEAVTLRGIAATAMLALICAREGTLAPTLSRRDWRLLAQRAAGEIAGAYFFLTAITGMGLAGATAILQAAPVALTLGAVLFLGERIGWRRWAAIAAGFVGVLIIIRPGAEDFNVFALYAAATVCCIALRDLSTRRLSPQLPASFAALSTAIAMLIAFGLAALTEGWVAPGARELALIGAASLFLVMAYLSAVAAMRVGDVAVVGLFRYTILLWALGLGWALYGEVPSRWAFLGAAIVVAAGVVTLRRTHRR